MARTISSRASPSTRRPTMSDLSNTSHVPTLRSMNAINDLLGESFNKPGPSNAGPLHTAPSNELALRQDEKVLSMDITPTRDIAELNSLLGNNYSRLRPGAVVIPQPSPLFPQSSVGTIATVPLEQAKSNARVEVDIILSSDTCTQGSFLKGHVRVHVRESGEPIWLSEGRLRIIGYECINNDARHTFYQCKIPLPMASPSIGSLYTTAVDKDGFSKAKIGFHQFSFAVPLPLDESCGIPRGVLQTQSGATVKYIAMV